MDVPVKVPTAPPRPVFIMRNWMVLTPVVDAAVMTNGDKNELVAVTKTLSPAINAPVGTVVQVANPSVEEAARVTSTNEQ